jgi:hypothetical protein
MSSLELLQQEMLAKGYPLISDLKADGEYQRFEIQDHKERPVSKLFPKRAEYPWSA